MSETIVASLLTISLVMTYAVIRICVGAGDKFADLRAFNSERQLLFATTRAGQKRARR